MYISTSKITQYSITKHILEKKLNISTLEDLTAHLATLVHSRQQIKIIWSNPLLKQVVRKHEVYTNEPKAKRPYAHHYIENNQSFTVQLDGEQVIQLMTTLTEEYKQTVVKTTIAEYQVLRNKKGKSKLLTKHVNHQDLIKDQSKQYLIPPTAPFLKGLGLATTNHLIKAEAQKKYRQINKFVEIIGSTLRPEHRQQPLSIYDFGCGKGYLTFGLYHHLSQASKQEFSVVGIDLKPAVIDHCNQLATDLNFTQLTFEQGDITNTALTSCDMLIALHACDIATDIALYKGIQSKASYIFSSPCCHKEVRTLMKKSDSPILRHGILKERQAEMLTDVLRTLLLEQHGYKADIFEFISSEHTAKNLMIRAIYTGHKKDNSKEIIELKQQYGVEGQQYLEGLLAG